MMMTHENIRTINWTTFNGSVTVISPVKIHTKNLKPSWFDVVPGGDRHIFDVADGVFSHLVKGKDKAFARMVGGKLEKLSRGWCDTVGDYIVTLLFPELLRFSREVEFIESLNAEPNRHRQIKISDYLRRLAESVKPSGVDLTDFECHYMYTHLLDQFIESESLSQVRFVLRPTA